MVVYTCYLSYKGGVDSRIAVSPGLAKQRGQTISKKKTKAKSSTF
jgi:hypothetical protein